MTGYALLVGVDEVNYDYYGENKNLCSSFLDTQLMFDLLFETSLFNSENILKRNSVQTKWSYLINDINYLKRLTETQDEDSFILLYFSGHSASIEHPFKPNTKVQFLCLYDQLVLEDKIRELLSQFSEKSKIFVVFDSCYSQGFGETQSKRILESVSDTQIKSLEKEFKYIFELHKTFYTNDILFYADYNYKPKAEILFLFACGETQQTYSGASCKEVSEFTRLFISNWKYLKSINTSANYIDLAIQLSNETNGKSRHLFKSDDPTSFFRTTFPLIFK
jgi:hypothetical protein